MKEREFTEELQHVQHHRQTNYDPLPLHDSLGFAARIALEVLLLSSCCKLFTPKERPLSNVIGIWHHELIGISTVALNVSGICLKVAKFLTLSILEAFLSKKEVEPCVPYQVP